MARVSVEERRVQLLDAAELVIARAGVAAATTRAVAREAGVQTSVLHYCFASRDELLGALIRRLGVRERDAVWAAISARYDDFGAALRAAADGYLTHLVAHPGEELMLFELSHYALRTPGMEHLAAEQIAMYLDSARAVLSRVAEVAGVRWTLPLDELARHIVTVTDGVTTTWLADRDTEASRAVLHRLVEQLAIYAEHPAQ